MRTLEDIRHEIERLSDRRAACMRALSDEFTSDLRAEHTALENQIAELWEEHRNARAALRFGDRDDIIRKARQEERLSRAA